MINKNILQKNLNLSPPIYFYVVLYVLRGVTGLPENSPFQLKVDL